MADNLNETIDALKEKVVSLANVDAEKHAAFNLLTTKWGGLVSEAEGIIADFSDVDKESTDAYNKLKDIVTHLKGNIDTVKSIGLNDLPDAVKQPMTSNADSPATLPSLTKLVTAADVVVTEDNKVLVSTPVPENNSEPVEVQKNVSTKTSDKPIEDAVEEVIDNKLNQ